MRPVHLTLLVFCHVLLAAVVIHFTSLAAASPLFEPHKAAAAAAVVAPVAPVAPQQQHEHELKQSPVQAVQPQQQQQQQQPKEALEQRSVVVQQPAQPVQQSVQQPKNVPSPLAAAPSHTKVESVLEARSAVALAQPKVKEDVVVAPVEQPAPKPAAVQAAPISQAQEQPRVAAVAPKVEALVPALTERKAEESKATAVAREPAKAKQGQKEAAIEPKIDAPLGVAARVPENAVAEPKVESALKAPTSPLANQQVELVQPPVAKEDKLPPVVPQPATLTAEQQHQQHPMHSVKLAEPVVPVPALALAVDLPPRGVLPVASAGKPTVVELSPSVTAEQSPSAPLEGSPRPLAARVPVVMGGLGPLHLLASTLCSYQVDKLVADEHLNQLYARRASVRRSLFEFMSLKFTNLEKLSSRLGYGLQVVPVKSPEDNKAPGLLPSHGWPVVGKCTAHDLKLMGEAAWCECNEAEQGCADAKPETGAKQEQAAAEQKAPVAVESKIDDEQPARITSNQHAVAGRAALGRSLESTSSFLPSPEESSVISRILHVGDIKDAPTVESSIYNLNLTQNQLASLEAQATSTQTCRRNALRYTKALFNHLAEDQKVVSETWPKLYALISADDCARKRMIDIVNALSGFRTDTTSIRRDNLEFAFAMDDLRAKVLESEVNVPLTFDRHFIEVEQFLQQSVRLMLANIQPKRAKLTSMRYRSLMYGTSQSSDDQCIDLHQRLLSRSYPSDCNPTQFGQLPDVLRMTASSLELWSIEKELSMQTSKMVDNVNSSVAGQQKVKDDVNECIANLVSS